MSEKVSYPQIPSTVWWGVRSILNRIPTATVDERFLGVQLNVQPAAAKQYVSELKRVGILNDHNKATPTANKWRLDETYAEAVGELLSANYPSSLLEIAPIGEADRQKVVSWFAHEGLGSGAAGNKAATYLMIASSSPADGNSKTATPPKKKSDRPEKLSPKASSKPSTAKERIDPIPLNLNVQIHISADASIDQIETIFSAMRRYLYETTSTT